MGKKKFFTLVRGDNIHVAPETKIIPAREFSELVSALEIKQKAFDDGETYKVQIADECEKQKAMAAQQGFIEGFQAWTEMIANLEAEISKVREEMQKIIAPVALKSAKKIVGRELELSESTIVDIVANSLKSVAQHKKVVIYVNRQDFKALDDSRPKLRTLFEDLETLSIQERPDVAPGGAIIETEKGVINAQIENQWRILENVLVKLFKPKSEPTHIEAKE